MPNFAAEQLSLHKHSFPWVCVHGEVNICVKYLMKVCSLRSPGIFSPAKLRSPVWCDQRPMMSFICWCHLVVCSVNSLWEPVALLLNSQGSQTVLWGSMALLTL